MTLLNPLHITFVAPFGLGQKTTVWARILPLARALVAQGHQASILIPPWDTPKDAGKQWVQDGVTIDNVPLWGGIPVVVGRLVQALQQQAPQIVHIVKPRAHAGLVQWWLWYWRKLRNAKYRVEHSAPFQDKLRTPNSEFRTSSPRIVLDIDDWEQSWAAINHYRWPVARFLAWQEEWGIRHADAITAASSWLTMRAQQYTPQTPVLYLPNGIEEKAYAIRNTEHELWNMEATGDNSPLAARHSSLAILLFTRFVEVEPAWLAEFWRVLAAQLPTAQLIVAGNALQVGRELLFQQQMQQLAPAAAAQVKWLGYVPQAQLEQLYPTLACAIFPAMNIPLLQAKCSVKLVTTLLHGVPVVASAVGEQAAYGAEGAAHLVDPAASPAQFAEAVCHVLQQPDQQHLLVQRAQTRLLTRYRWTHLGEQLAGFYQTIWSPTYESGNRRSTI